MDNKNLSLEGLIFEAIELSVVNNIMYITLNRPEKKNAINPVMANEIIYSLAFAAQERDIRVVVIKANGDVFVLVVILVLCRVNHLRAPRMCHHSGVELKK